MTNKTRSSLLNLVNAFTAVFQAVAEELSTNPVPAPVADATPVETPAPEKPKRGRPAASKEPASPSPAEETPAAAADPAPAAEPEPEATASGKTLDDMRALIKPLVTGGRGGEVKPIIEKYAPTLAQMKPSDYAAFEKDIEALSY